MAYTLGEAARATGLNKSSILKALKTGKISGAKDAHGQWAIEPCELHRVYPARSEAPEAPGADNGAGNDRHPTENGATDALVAELRTVIADLRQDRDAWRDQAQRLALPAPSQPGRWWRWRRAG